MKRRILVTEAITSINVTPLVDVCLVLVIIFMVLTPLTMQAGIEVSNSRANASVGVSAARDVVVWPRPGEGRRDEPRGAARLEVAQRLMDILERQVWQ